MRFSWDRASGLVVPIAEKSPLGGATYWVYGPGGVPVEQIGADGTVVWLHHDQLGSTRAVTDAAGATVATFSWDPYGNPVGRSGSIDVRVGYAGQYTDRETGLVYLRARHYDPTTGQFLTRDPLVSITRETYGYTGNNPLNMTDPSGLFGIPTWVPGIGGMCVDIADPNCENIAEQHAEVTQGVVDFASGVLDVNPITAATNALGLSDTSQYANECSGWYRGGQVSMIAAELAIGTGAGRSLFSRQGLEIGASRQIGRSGSRGSRFVRAHVDDAVHRMDDGRLIGRHLQVDRWISGVSNSHKSSYWELPGWLRWP